MFKVFVILVLCGIIAAQESSQQNAESDKTSLFKKPFQFKRPLTRLSKRDSGLAADSGGPCERVGLIARIRKAIEQRRQKKSLRKPRGLKYYFNFASPNGGCGCGGPGSGGTGKLNCKCDNKKNSAPSQDARS